MGFGRVSSPSPYCWFHGSSFKGFSVVFLFSDCLNSNHLKSRIEHGVWTFFPRHICSAVTETIWVTNYTTRFGTKNVQKTNFEAAEIILDPWNQQLWELSQHILAIQRKVRSLEDCCFYKPTTILCSLVTTIFYSNNLVLQSYKIDVFYL